MRTQLADVFRTTSLIAGIIAAIITLLVPFGYYSVSRLQIEQHMEAENELMANGINRIIVNNPETWRFEELRVSEIIHRNIKRDEFVTCRVRDMKGMLVAESLAELPQPVIVKVDDIYDAGVPAARIELTLSIRPLVERTILVFILSALLAGLIFIVLRLLPMRAVIRVYQDLAHSELRYRALCTSMREGLGLFEPVREQDGRMVNFRLVEANPSFHQITDLTVNDPLCAKGEDIMNGALNESLDEIASVIGNDQTFHFEKEDAAQGKYYDIFIFSPMADTFAALVEDITDRKRAEVVRAKMEAQLHQARKMEAIGTLVSGIAHNFNNILTAIFGYTELAMEEKDLERRREDLEQIKLGANRAKELVSQMKAFSQTEGHAKQPLQLAPVINEALVALRSSIPRTIEIRQNITSNGKVLVDLYQMHQVIKNLCINAYHSMLETGGILTVSLDEIEIQVGDESYGELAPGRYMKLEVSDTGCGIGPEIKDRIFEPFFTNKEIGEGTGLGLSVVLGIIKRHNGHISFYSELGKGTTFHVYLPLFEEKIA